MLLTLLSTSSSPNSSSPTSSAYLQLHNTTPEEDIDMHRVGFEIMIPVSSNIASNRDATVTKSLFSNKIVSNEQSFYVISDDSAGT
jgi:hypothetical protein